LDPCKQHRHLAESICKKAAPANNAMRSKDEWHIYHSGRWQDANCRPADALALLTDGKVGCSSTRCECSEWRRLIFKIQRREMTQKERDVPAQSIVFSKSIRKTDWARSSNKSCKGNCKGNCPCNAKTVPKPFLNHSSDSELFFLSGNKCARTSVHKNFKKHF
jgi:hypothetical protein